MFMRHPDSGPIATVTDEAFELVWKAKGWEKVEDQEGAAAAVAAMEAQTPGLENLPQPTGPGYVTDYESMTIPQLEQAAEARADVDLTGATRKPDIVARFQEADDGLAQPGDEE
jgi:hypothetical protein